MLYTSEMRIQKNPQGITLVYLAIINITSTALEMNEVWSKDPFVIKAREHKYIQLFDNEQCIDSFTLI